MHPRWPSPWQSCRMAGTGRATCPGGRWEEFFAPLPLVGLSGTPPGARTQRLLSGPYSRLCLPRPCSCCSRRAKEVRHRSRCGRSRRFVAYVAARRIHGLRSRGRTASATRTCTFGQIWAWRRWMLRTARLQSRALNPASRSTHVCRSLCPWRRTVARLLQVEGRSRAVRASRILSSSAEALCPLRFPPTSERSRYAHKKCFVWRGRLKSTIVQIEPKCITWVPRKNHTFFGSGSLESNPADDLKNPTGTTSFFSLSNNIFGCSLLLTGVPGCALHFNLVLLPGIKILRRRGRSTLALVDTAVQGFQWP